MSLLSLTSLTVRRGGCPVVDAVTCDLPAGQLVGLIGPNGAGKTTMMRAALGLLPHEGQSTVATMRPAARARQVAWMPQQREIAWPVTVETVVALGRMPHRPTGAPLSDMDQAAVDAALARMGLEAYRHRPANALSGGEQARVLIARALAQDTPLLMTDEPIAGLDPAAQIATLRVFRDLAAEGHTVLVSLHDLSLAARYCDRLLMMHQGRLVADGAPRDVLTETNLAEVFHIRARVIDTDHGALFQPIDVLP